MRSGRHASLERAQRLVLTFAVSVLVARPVALPVTLIVSVPGRPRGGGDPLRFRRIVSLAVPLALTVLVDDATVRPRSVTDTLSFVLAAAVLRNARTPERMMLDTLTRPFAAVSDEIAATRLEPPVVAATV